MMLLAKIQSNLTIGLVMGCCVLLGFVAVQKYQLDIAEITQADLQDQVDGLTQVNIHNQTVIDTLLANDAINRGYRNELLQEIKQLETGGKVIVNEVIREITPSDTECLSRPHSGNFARMFSTPTTDSDKEGNNRTQTGQ